MCTVWHVDKYKITFKFVSNHWTNETLKNIVFSSGQHLGLSFTTYSRIFFSSEYINYKTFIPEIWLQNKNCKFQENLLRSGIIDAKAQRLRNAGI